MLKFISIGLLCLIFGGTSNSAWAMGKHAPLETADEVQLDRYAGKWYEIARLPQFFERNCTGVTAEYTVRPDGKLGIINTCRKNRCDGPIERVHGQGKLSEEDNPARLKVSFVWPTEADYWILEIAPDYSYSVVGTPNREGFWILSRTPTLLEGTIQSITDRFQEQGFDLKNLVRTLPCELRQK